MTVRRVKRTSQRQSIDVSAELARRLSGVPGADFSACDDCGSALTPVMVKVGQQAEVCGIACLPCQTFAPVCVGVVMTEPVQR
jgi:hypothetical protein